MGEGPPLVRNKGEKKARGRQRPDPAVNADSSAGNQQTLLLLTALIIVAVILLIVHRYREELRRDRGRDGDRAARHAAHPRRLRRDRYLRHDLPARGGLGLAARGGSPSG